MDLFTLTGKIAIDKSDTDKKIDETSQKAEKLGSKTQTLGSKFQSVGQKTTELGKKMAPVSVGAAAIGTAIMAASKKTADYTDKVDKQSQKLGISRKAYQEWDYVLSQNGASIDSMKVGLKTLNNTFDTVNQKADTTGTAFERLGLSYDDLKGKSTEEVFDITVRKLQECTDETERTKLATELFGKAGVELAPMLNSGAESTDKLKRKAHDLGLVLDDEAVDAGVNFTDAMDTLERSLSSTGMTIASAIMPVITDVANWLSEHQTEIKSIIDAVVKFLKAVPEPVKIITLAVLALATVLSPFLMVLGHVISSVGGIVTALGKLRGAMNIVGIISKLGGAFQALFAIMSANPIVIIIAAIAALVLAFITLWNTNEDFRNFWINAWNQMKETAKSVIDGVSTFFKTAFDGLKSFFSSFAEGVKSSTSSLANAVRNAVKSGMDAVSNTVKSVLNGIKNAFSSIWNGIKSVVSGVMGGIKSVISSGMNAAKSVVSSVLGGIKNAFSTVWNGAKGIVQGAIGAIKGFLNFEWHLPELKLPHFKITGDFSLNPPSVPKVDISWYKKAYDSPMLLDSPTVFGYSQASGKLLGGGDGNGSEVVAGSGKLMSMIGDAVSQSNGGILPALNEIIQVLGEMRSDDGGGDIVVPLYIGNELLDEMIVKSKKRINLRSGGLANV